MDDHPLRPLGGSPPLSNRSLHDSPCSPGGRSTGALPRRRSYGSITTRPVALAAAALLVASPLHGQCSSAGRFANVIWETYVEEAREVGCLSPVAGPRKWVACAMSVPTRGLHLLDTMIGHFNNWADGGWRTIGPRRLDPEWQSGTLWGTTGRLWLGAAPVHSSTTVEVMKRDGRAPAEVVVCASSEDGSTRVLARERFDRGRDNRNEKFTFVFDSLEADVLSVKVDAKDWIATNRFQYRVRVTTEALRNDLGPVTGFADLHLHQAAELGFGGNNIWGSHIGPKSEALKEDGLENSWEQAVLRGPVQWLLGMHSLPSAVLGEGESRHGGGHPGFDRWPHFNDVTHQQVHEEWLKEAHDGGLNLIVVSAVNFEGFCYGLKAVFPRPGDKMGCRDMENVERQLEAFVKMADQRPWYEIAVDPWHARQIIHDGDLAVVMSMEVSNLLPRSEGDFVYQLDRLWGDGLRTLQPAHETDSRFAGAAPHRTLFGMFNFLKWYPYRSGIQGFVKDEDGKNVMGLTEQGESLLDAMIDRHMLIDVAHLSERSVEDVYRLVADRYDYYPLYDSHTRFQSLLTGWDLETQREFLTTDEQIDFIKATGGMVGLRTGQNAILSAAEPEDGGVINDCDGSSKSFAQLVHYGWKAGVPMGIGSDFNGFINQLGPRFGEEGCPRGGIRTPYVTEDGEFATDEDGLPLVADITGAAAEEAARQQNAQDEDVRARCTIGGSADGGSFHVDGLRHVGYLPDLVADLEAQETPGVESLKSSAEAFLRMWERAWDPDRSRVTSGDGLAQRIAETVPTWSPCGAWVEGRGVLAQLPGNWVRVAGNNPRNNGMRVHFEGGEAVVTSMPEGGGRFVTGQVLWTEVQPNGDLEVRGSTGSYYPSTLTFQGPDRLHIDVDRAASPGNDQTWERAGPSLDGVWVLVEGGEAGDRGIQVTVEGDEGVVRYLPGTAGGALRVGVPVWRDIGAQGRLEVRMADRAWRPGHVELVDEDRLRVEVEGPDGASIQGWARQGSEAERIGETEKNLLPEPGALDRETVLEVGSGAAEPSVSALLRVARDSIASPSWGTVVLEGESETFLVLGCRVPTETDDALFVRGVGETAEGEAFQVALERTVEAGSWTESASLAIGDPLDGEVWARQRYRDPGGAWYRDRGRSQPAEGPVFTVGPEGIRTTDPLTGGAGETGGPRVADIRVSCPGGNDGG